MPTSARRFGLDFVRAAAVSLVLVAHGSVLLMPWWTPGQGMIMLAYWGVELFFVLSGFLIGGILIDGHGGGPRWVPRFWVRRWMRTLPNYYLFLALNVLFVASLQGGGAPWPAYAFFVQNLAWPHPEFFGEAWSLALEEIFYLLAPLVAVAVAPFVRTRRAAVLWMLGGLALFLLARIVSTLALDPLWDAGVRKISLLRLDAIGWGVLAVYATRRFAALDRHRVALAVLGVVLSAVSAMVYLGGDPNQGLFARSGLFTLTSLGFALLLPWAARWEGIAFGEAGRRCIVWLAVASYALYLTHMLVIRLIMETGYRGTEPARIALAASVYLLVSLAVAGAVYRWFERPTLQSRDAVSRALFGDSERASSAVPRRRSRAQS